MRRKTQMSETCLFVRGYRILVKPDDIETVTESGIVLVVDERVEAAAQQTGIVVGVGHTCWKSSTLEQDPWAKVGDRVLFSKFAGRAIIDPVTGEEFMTMNDEDVICVIGTRENEDE